MMNGRFSLSKLFESLWVFFVVAFLLVPLVVVMISSFSPSGREYVQFPPSGFSLFWYTRIPKQFFMAFFNSIIIGLAASVISMILGVSTAMSLVRGNYPGKGLLKAFFSSPLQIPLIVLGVIFLQYYVLVGRKLNLRLTDTYLGLILAHVIITFPFVLGTVGSVLERFDTALEEAALVHGASKWSTFRRVTLPIITPGIYAGALYAFINSFGNVPVSLFLIGSNITTLPVEIFYALEFDFSPAILALSTLTVVFSVVLVQLIQRLTGFGLTKGVGGGA